MKHVLLFLTFFLFSLAEASHIHPIADSVAAPAEPVHHDTLPDPYHLHPQWWHYFEVNETELAQRIEKTVAHLNALYERLPSDDQHAAHHLIISFETNLKALPAAKREQPSDIYLTKALHKNYTLEQQLQIHHQFRKVQLELKKDHEELEELKTRILKSHKNIDTLFANYLRGSNAPTAARLLSGLEIMAQRTATGIAEENLRVLKLEIEHQQTSLQKLEKELSVASKHFDASLYDEQQMESDIQLAQRLFEKKELEYSRAEAYAIEVRGSGLQGRAVKHLMSQKSTHSAVDQALAWTSLAFYRLKYNLIMHVNHRFTITGSEMHDRVLIWKEQLAKVIQQQSNWEHLTLQEQERIRKDQAILIANQESSDSSLSRILDGRRQVTSDTLSKLQNLNENIANTQWLIDQIEVSIRANRFFLMRWWSDFVDFLGRFWTGIGSFLGFSLFKIFDVPITVIILLRIACIIAVSYLVSYLLRFAFNRWSQKHKNIRESTLYNVGTLIHYTVLAIGAIFVLSSIGLDFSNIMIVAGALSFGIGLGLQSFVLNFLCGLKILFERKIKIGDYIELQTGHYGKVTEIHVQNTVIYTSDGIEIVIPNSELLGAPLVNWTMNNDYRRLHIPFSTSYDNDKNMIRMIVSEAAKEIPCTIYKYGDPQVWLVKFGDYSLDFELVVWVNYKAKSFTDSKEGDYLWVIETALRAQGIKLPTPQQQVFFQRLAKSSEEVAHPV